MRRRLRAVVLVVAALLTVIYAAPAVAAISVTTEQSVREQVWYNSCTNEFVKYSGTYSYTRITNYDADGEFVSQTLSLRVTLSGIGLTSGDKYRFTNVYHESRPAATSVGQAEPYTFTQAYIEISQGRSDNYAAHGVMHFTVMADGTGTGINREFFGCGKWYAEPSRIAATG